MKRKVQCSKCGYEWKTKSNLKFITCPNCQLKVKVKEVKK